MKRHLKRLARTHSPRLILAAVVVMLVAAAFSRGVAPHSASLTPPPAAQAATWQGDRYGLPDYGGYGMPINCYSYQDYDRNYYGQTDCRASNLIAEFSAHSPGVANGPTLWTVANNFSGYVYYGCCGWQRTSGPSSLTVSYGSPVSLEWMCMPYQNVTYSYCKFEDPYGNCYDTGEATYTNYFFQSGANQGGYAGSRTVTITSDSTYTLTCSGSAGSYSMSINIYLADPCPTAAWEPWNNGVYVIQPGATRKVYDARYSSTKYCVTNNSGNYVVIGGGGGDPSGQLSTFRSYAARVGVTVFDH